MNANESNFTEDVCRQLEVDGYEVHAGAAGDEGLGCKHWFTWCKPGMMEAQVGPTCENEFEAWASALRHRLSNSAIVIEDVERDQASKPMGPFHPSTLPDWAFDAKVIATRFCVSEQTAVAQVERHRRETVYVNDVYQVNVQRVHAPFGATVGDMLWLSIKRRDKGLIRDWRELQEVKNRIVGPEHEAFEVFPAESRLVDVANQWHLWVFVDSKVRLPVGFRTREVGGSQEAKAVGARQRDFAPAGA